MKDIDISSLLTQERYTTNVIAKLFHTVPKSIIRFIDQGFLAAHRDENKKWRIVEKKDLELFIRTYHMEGIFEEVIFSSTEAAHICKISPQTINRVYNRGLIIGAYRFPSEKNETLYIPLSSLENMMRTEGVPVIYLEEYLKKNYSEYYLKRYQKTKSSSKPL